MKRCLDTSVDTVWISIAARVPNKDFLAPSLLTGV
jgi:hypothetical protein